LGSDIFLLLIFPGTIAVVPRYQPIPTQHPTFSFGDRTAVPSQGDPSNQTSTEDTDGTDDFFDNVEDGPPIRPDDTAPPGGEGTMEPGGGDGTEPGGMEPGGEGTMEPGGEGTMASGGEGTMAPGGEGTMDPGAETQGPTTLQPVELTPFGLLYDINRDEIPPTDDYTAAAALTIQYIDEYFKTAFPESGESGSVSTGAVAVQGDTAFSLLSGAVIDFSGTATFSDAGAIPTPADLDASLETAFTQPSLQIALDLLATLPPENLFSTAKNIRKVENTAVGAMMAKRQRQSTPTQFDVRKGFFTFAAAGMMGLSVFFAIRFLQGQHAHKRRPKTGAYFGGDDIILGDPCNAYLVER